MKRGPNVSKLKIISSILKSQNSASLPPFIFNTPQLNHALVGKFPHIWDALQPRKELRKPPVAAVRRARAVGGRLGVLPEGAIWVAFSSGKMVTSWWFHDDLMVFSWWLVVAYHDIYWWLTGENMWKHDLPSWYFNEAFFQERMIGTSERLHFPRLPNIDPLVITVGHWNLPCLIGKYYRNEYLSMAMLNYQRIGDDLLLNLPYSLLQSTWQWKSPIYGWFSHENLHW